MDANATLNSALDHVRDALRNRLNAEALATTAELLTSYPDAVRIWRARASALESAGQHEAAAEAYNRVLDIIPADAGALLGCARALSASGRALEAAEVARQALDYEPNDTVMQDTARLDTSVPGAVQPSIGRIAFARGQFDAGLTNRAIARMRNLLETQPTRADALVVLADMLWRSSARHIAGELCHNILQSYPQCLNAHAMLAALGRRNGDAALERAHTVVVTRLDPDHRESYGLLGDQSPLRIQDVPFSTIISGQVEESAQTRSEWVDELIASSSTGAGVANRRDPAPTPADTTPDLVAPAAIIGTITADQSLDLDDGSALDLEADLEADLDLEAAGDLSLDDAPAVDVLAATAAAQAAAQSAAKADDLKQPAQPAAQATPTLDAGEATAVTEVPPLDWSSIDDGQDAQHDAMDSDDELLAEEAVDRIEGAADGAPLIERPTHVVTEEGIEVEPLDWSQVEPDDAIAFGKTNSGLSNLSVTQGRAGDETERGAEAPAFIAHGDGVIRVDTMKAGGKLPGGKGKSKDKSDDLLSAARQALDVAQLDRAAEHYEQLIAKGKLLDEIVDDLNTAALTYPNAKRLYEVLGQAHTRKGNIPAALEAYRRALESVE